jgi:tetratricopeptide (TPR) repeat protein
MPHGTEALSDLAARWAEQPQGRSFGPLAEALRKRGAFSEALRILEEGLAREPTHLPGHLVLSRIRMDQQDWPGAEVALRAALNIDPSHPGVLEGMAALADASGKAAEGRAWREALAAALPGAAESPQVAEPPLPNGEGSDDAQVEEPDDFIQTESLAALYRRQGHLEKAIEVYEVLVRQSPGNEALAARREALRGELLGSRPRPYDSALSGGPSVRAWLAGIAASAPAAPRETGYDAFFEAPDIPPDESADFEAFQKWLKGLGR